MRFLDSAAKGIRPLLPILLLVLQLIQLQCVSGEGGEDGKDCSAAVLENRTRCIDPGTYYFKINGEVCRLTVKSAKDGCPRGKSTGVVQNKNGGLSGRKLATAVRDGGGCMIPKNCANSRREPSWPKCSKYVFPVFAAGPQTIKMYIEGDGVLESQWAPSYFYFCYDVKINGRRSSSYYLNGDWSCQSNVANIEFDVNEDLTALTTTSYPYETYELNENKEFDVTICFNRCWFKTVRVIAATMFDANCTGDGTTPGGETEEEKKERERLEKAYSNCTHYNGTIPSKCWQRGCQYSYFNATEKCITGEHSCEARTYKNCICSNNFCENFTGECYNDPDNFYGKLSCRRPDTYYVYHPKILCYNDGDRGNCDATGTYSVNLGGEKLRDIHEIDYIADKESNFRDPNNTRRTVIACRKVEGVRHPPTVKMYGSVYVGNKTRPDPSRHGVCIYYPVPICQNGEYMLTIRMVEPHYKSPNSRCTEVRINDVPIMIHMDPFTLAGNKSCGVADVTLMFIATGGNDSKNKTNYSLYLKGHLDPINVTASVMNLQFCIGYECNNDHHPAVSAFALERLGTKTKVCNQDGGTRTGA